MWFGIVAQVTNNARQTLIQLHRMQEISELITGAVTKGAWISGPATTVAIAAIERELGVVLPTSYKQFLREFGALAIRDSTVSGVLRSNPADRSGGSLVGDTYRFRHERELPQELLVIQPDDDAPYCLDFSQRGTTGEVPVVCYQLSTKRRETVADSFASWLRKFIFAEA